MWGFRATPRSSTFTCPGGGSIRLAGLTSRWTRPCLCRCSNPRAARLTTSQASATGLPKEDPDAAEQVAKALRRDGVELTLSCQISRVEKRGHEKVVQVAC